MSERVHAIRHPVTGHFYAQGRWIDWGDMGGVPPGANVARGKPSAYLWNLASAVGGVIWSAP